MYMPDNYDRWKQHDEELEMELRNLPECEYCGHKIQDDFFYLINGEIICEECLNDSFRKRVDDFIE